MGFIVRHGDPGVLVQLASATGAAQGRGGVEEITFQDRLARGRAEDATRLGIEADTARTNNEIARARVMAQLNREGIALPRVRQEDRQPLRMPVQQPQRYRDTGEIRPRDEIDFALRAGALEEQQRRNLAAEEERRAARMDRGYVNERRLGQGDERIEQGQARVDQGAMRVAQGDRRLTQTDTRMAEQQRANAERETIQRERMAAQQERARTNAAGKVAKYSSSLDKDSESAAVASAVPFIKNMLGPALSPDGPVDKDGAIVTDESGMPAQWSATEKKAAMRLDAALKSLGRIRDKQGALVLSLPELQQRMTEIAADPDLAKTYLPVIERDRNVIIRDVVETFQRVQPVLESSDPVQAAGALEQAAQQAGMTPEDYAASVEFLMQQGVIAQPGDEPPMGAGPPPEQEKVSEAAKQAEKQVIEFDPETGTVYIKGSINDPRRLVRNGSE